MKGILRKGKSMDRENIYGQLMKVIMEIFMKIKDKGLEFINGQMADFIKVNGDQTV